MGLIRSFCVFLFFNLLYLANAEKMPSDVESLQSSVVVVSLFGNLNNKKKKNSH